MCCGCWKRFWSRSTIRQNLAAVGIGQGAVGLGMMLAWSVKAIPKIVESNDLGVLTESNKKWTANLFLIGAVVSVLLTGFLVDRIGRRISFLINVVPLMVGAVLMGAQPSLWRLYLGRFLAGYSGGAFSIITPLYITEMAEDRLRGQIGYSFAQQMFAGITVVISMSAAPWHVVALNSIPIVMISAVAMYFLPESPKYLFQKGENFRALESLTWFRFTTEQGQLDAEILAIQDRVVTLNAADQPSTLKQWLQHPAMKPIGISAGLMLLQQLTCGANFLLGIIPVYEDIVGQGENASTLYLVTAIVAMITIGISSNFVDRFGRRIMLISSCVLMALSAVALGICYGIQVDDADLIVGRLKWFRLVFYTIYIVAFSVGLGPISWLLMGELVPDLLRGPGASIVVLCNWLPAFLLVQYYSSFVEVFTMYGCFWISAVICIITAVYSYFVVPETRGKSLIEIQEYFEQY